MIRGTPEAGAGTLAFVERVSRMNYVDWTLLLQLVYSRVTTFYVNKNSANKFGSRRWLVGALFDIQFANPASFALPLPI